MWVSQANHARHVREGGCLSAGLELGRLLGVGLGGAG